MNWTTIADSELLAKFQRAAAMTESELLALGLSVAARNAVLKRLIVPEAKVQKTCCWGWEGGFNNGRPIVTVHGIGWPAYRVLYILLNRVRLERKDFINHEGCCPDCKSGKLGIHQPLIPSPACEFGGCTCPYHHKVGPAKRSALYRSLCGTLAGDRNGTRTKPESRPRGRDNPKSQFKEPDADRKIQAIRATWDSLGGDRGMIFKLHRAFGKSRDAITNVVNRQRYLDVPDDPTAALTIDELNTMVVASGYKPKPRTKWPVGDQHPGARFPVAMKALFAVMYYRISQRDVKTAFVNYVAWRFGISREAVQNVAYSAQFKAAAQAEAALLASIVSLNAESLELVFGRKENDETKG